MSKFFDSFPKKEKFIKKQIEMTESEWSNLEKYIEFGKEKTGDKSLSMSVILPKIIANHTAKDRDFKVWSK